jgi:hypothetical protein
MKAAVEPVFAGKDHLCNRRFLQRVVIVSSSQRLARRLLAHEKGQVENQAGLARERFFTPRLRFKNYGELNAWLPDKCIAYAKMHHHPELAGQTIWEVFEAERHNSFPIPAASADSTTSLPPSRRPAWCASITINTSVATRAAGRPKSTPMETTL